MAIPAVRKEAKGYVLFDVTKGGANRLWLPIRGLATISFTPSSITPQTGSVQDPDREDYDFSGDVSNAQIDITDCVFDGGAVSLEFLEDNVGESVPTKFVASGSAERIYTSPGAGTNGVTVEIDALTGAWIGHRKVTLAQKGSGVVPDATEWGEGYQFSRGGEIYPIVDVIDSANFVIRKQEDSFTAVSTIAEVGTASDDEFIIGNFPQIFGDADTGHLCKVLSAGVSGAALNDVWKYQVQLQPAGNRISKRPFLPFGDSRLLPTQAA